MTYGIEIKTADGDQNISSLFSAQIVYETQHTSQSGSDSVPGGVTISNAIGICIPLDGKAPLTDVDISNDLVSWFLDDSAFGSSHYTSNFLIRVYRIF